MTPLTSSPYGAERGVEDVLLALINNVYEQLQQAQSPVTMVFVHFGIALNTIQPHLIVDKLVNSRVNPNRVSQLLSCPQSF